MTSAFITHHPQLYEAAFTPVSVGIVSVSVFGPDTGAGPAIGAEIIKSCSQHLHMLYFATGIGVWLQELQPNSTAMFYLGAEAAKRLGSRMNAATAKKFLEGSQPSAAEFVFHKNWWPEPHCPKERQSWHLEGSALLREKTPASGVLTVPSDWC